MSHLLWKYYWDNDVDKFRRLLASAGPNGHPLSKSPAVGSGAYHLGAAATGGGAGGASPRLASKLRKTPNYSPASGKAKDSNASLGKNDVNSRDHAGLTILLRAASSINPNAILFVQALLGHPAIDLYAQDPESGWNALHRCLYSGNISIARILLAKERADLTSHTAGPVSKVGQLIKTKDHEGNSPFDLYNSSIAARSLRQIQDGEASDDSSETSEPHGDLTALTSIKTQMSGTSVRGDELFVFGSNKNLSLGVGDEDDRQYPERIFLQRPDHLLRHLHETALQERDIELPGPDFDLDQVPTLERNQRLIIQNVVMSKFHSAILTDDPISNLYMSGVGRGGRLGLGDENTHFKFVPLLGPLADKKIRQVALGQNHSVAIAGHGELWTWGLNTDSQLGYVLPPPLRADEEPMSLVPRQVFGSLKKEVVLGIAASSVHSVAHTGSSLYCWGRNLGQLALMDADSRSLDVQQTPRKVAASLLSAPIEMVSAIDKATTCLLSNHTVWVFTNYGYNLVKFPFPDVFSNHNLATSTFSTRYDTGRRDICRIVSGGDTIAALTARGDLFTMQLKGDNSVPAGSTTNPVKIKGAVTQPQCIWQSRKDGVASVSVGEHGSVVICTESGAVWKRVKRAKAKIFLSTDASEAKRKDFKFQRIPYITDCVSVSSSTFGAFAAIRKDSKVMAEQIGVSRQTLRDDLGSLLCLEEFFPPESITPRDPSWTAWYRSIEREGPGSVVHRILGSRDIEADLLEWLQYNSSSFDVDMEIRTTSAPEIKLPFHGWLMAGRSPVLRTALNRFRRGETEASADTFLLEELNGKIVLTLLHVDIYTVLNIVLYAYQDAMIPVWNYTREAPHMAHRFRQVRSELMKVATRLSLPKLERAARLQAPLERSQDMDLQSAIKDPMFWEDGDAILELDGGELIAHSQLLCQRCPFFEGMFFGRSQGQWLASRRDPTQRADRIRIDLKHIRPDIFSYVRTFLYGDVGAEIFDEVAVPTLDDFSELIIEVLSVANELMIDRLAQICQMLIGKFVNTRNIAHLLNEISPCAVSEFKDTGLEYICLQLESMLENHLLDGLDDELLQGLDGIVRDNQLACLPVARSGRAELLLHDKYPNLLLDIEEERRTRVREMGFRYAQREEEKRPSMTTKPRFGTPGEPLNRASETKDKGTRQLQGSQAEAPSPALRSKESHGDMMFNMEEEEAVAQGKMGSRHSPQLELPEPLVTFSTEAASSLPEGWKIAKGKTKADAARSPESGSLSQSQRQPCPQTPRTPMQAPDKAAELPSAKPGSPWASSSAFPTAKLDLRDMLSEASSKSSLTAALAAQATKDAAGKPQPKMSQKERKRQMQMQLEAQVSLKEEQAKAVPWETVPSGSGSGSGKNQPAWKKVAEPVAKTSLQDAMSADVAQRTVPAAKPKPLVVAESSAQPAQQRRTASPDTRFPGQGRTHGSALAAAAAAASSSLSTSSARQPISGLVPHSKQYIQPVSKAETWLGASMADIIGQQRRERELVREAVAKRSLQEIQQEQAFQEWWDQESRRTQEEEARRGGRAAAAAAGGGKEGKEGRGGRRTRALRGDNGNKNKNDSDSNSNSRSNVNNSHKNDSSSNKNDSNSHSSSSSKNDGDSHSSSKKRTTGAAEASKQPAQGARKTSGTQSTRSNTSTTNDGPSRGRSAKGKGKA